MVSSNRFSRQNICHTSNETHGTIPDDVRYASELYYEVAKTLLFGRNSLHHSTNGEQHIMGILSEAESSDREYFLPWWVPEWKAPLYHRFWSYAIPAGYKAAGDSVISLSPCDDPNHIRLSGKIFDTIDLISSIAPSIQDVDPKVAKQVRSRLTLAETLAFSKLPPWINESSSIAARCQRYVEGYIRENAYCRTLVGDNRPFAHQHESLHAGGGENETDVTGEEMMCYYNQFRHFLTLICPGGVINTAGFSRLSPMLLPLQIGFHAFWGDHDQRGRGPEVFRHARGDTWGWGRRECVRATWSASFSVVPVPWVIRQEGKEYVLIGECYVHGYMNGEVINSEHLPVQDIVLK